MKRTLSIPLILVLAACQTEQHPDETYTGETFGRIAGFVTDIDGNGLDGVQVETLCACDRGHGRGVETAAEQHDGFGGLFISHER